MKKEAIAKYAYRHVPFYKEMQCGENVSWMDYPIIEKSMIQQKVDFLFSPEYMTDLLSDKLEHILTSGSTGECLEILWKREQNIKSLIPLWKRRKTYYGILPNDPSCYFFTTKVVNGEELEIENTEFGLGFNKMDLTENKIFSIYNKMLEFNPKWIIVQPSIIILFMNVIKKHKLPLLPELKYIELTGERILNDTKKSLAVFFSCNVASQYGAYEVNSIAYECPEGNLHIVSENVYVETIEDNNICITSLQNKVMPFIRYKIGDKGKIITNHSCLCGCNEPIIELDMARENDWIYNSDGTVCHSDLFCNVITKINLILQQAVKQYQIIQTAYEAFEVYLVVDENEEIDLIKELFVKNYEKYQKKSKFDFFFVDFLFPSEKTGKLAWFISKIKEENSASENIE